MRFSSLVPLCCCLSSLAAQPAAVKIPGLGFAWDGRSQQIRPIHGIPGAAILGDGAGKTSFASVVVAPRQDVALAIASETGKLHLIRLSPGDIEEVPGIDAPSRIVFSPSGTAALILGPRLHVVTDLSGSPAVQELAPPVDAAEFAALALSDDGQLALFSARSGDTPSTWLLAPGMSPLRIALPAPIAAAAFQPGSREAIAFDPGGTGYRILNSSIPGEVQSFYPGSAETAGLVAMRISTDGKQVYTVNRRGSAAVIDAETGSAASVNCACSPTGLEPLGPRNLFRMTEISDRPVMLLDVSTSSPRVWFVPSDAPMADSAGSGQ